MPRRYLFGPVPASFADQNLRRHRDSGACVCFNAAGDTDLTVHPADTWEAVVTRLPADWRPDFIALYLPYTTVPTGLWSAPVPLVGLAADWNLLWHDYRRLRRCDLLLTDAAGVEAFAREGLPARPANLFGCGRDLLEQPAPDGPRDLDVLFVGNLHPAVQRERLPWLARLARLGHRWRVSIRTNVFGADYRRLLRRARIVFNRSIRGECNRRVFEAAAAGALLFQEAGNREVPAYFRHGQECVYYNEDNLESLLAHYLTHEEDRRALADAARARVRDFGFESLWETALEEVEQEWAGLRERARSRPVTDPVEDLLARTRQAMGSSDGADASLPADLEAALANHPDSAALHNARGLVVNLERRGNGPTTAALAGRAAAHFQRAVAASPGHVIAALNLTETCVGIGQSAQAIEAARNALALLDREEEIDPRVLDAGHFPAEFDHFRVEWERAAWENAGRPAAEARAKCDLLRWRLHTLLGELTGDLVHYHEAALARPDLPLTRAALGCALGRKGRAREAVAHLRYAVAGDPLDHAAARALHQALTDCGDTAGAARLAAERRLLHCAAPQVAPAESWFADPPPGPDELASLVVLCCNQLEYTRQCLESVLRHTRPPYELMLVDNGSTDGTADYLEEIRTRPGPARVEVIRNDRNVGYPAGCNQALARARGRHVVFLNNDTVVTEGWLEGLVAWALHDWPRVGLVGAVTNYAPPPQQVPGPYPDLGTMAEFAARRRREYAGRALRVERLSGFCLLARREVLQQVGGFDERFGLGFFDDDDLCVRAHEAGYSLLVALNVFVHHFGSRTFTGLGVDCRKQLLDNLEQFRAKWGAERSAGYRLLEPPPPAAEKVPGAPAPGAGCETAAIPTAVVPAHPRAHRPRVSLCLIVKNEEQNLPACLGSAADLVGEVIVVDTGSTDATREVAARFGAKVFDFAWCDDFAAARNECLRHAAGDWIFWLDADDRLDEENRQKLRALFADLGTENAAYAMKCLCLPDATGAATVVDHVRLFRNHPQVRWTYRVHEQILPAIRRQGGEVRWADVVIHHTGYQDPALRARKLERDLRLLHQEDADRPDDPFTLFNLGSVYQELRRPAEALPLLRRSLERSHPTDSIVRKLHALIVQCHRQLGQSSPALAACLEGRRFYPDDTELLFLEGVLRREHGDLPGAEAALARLLEVRPAAHFGSVDAGLRGYKARHNLGVVCHQQGRFAEAESHWQLVVSERPDFLPAWLGLAEVYLGQKKWEEVKRIAADLSARGRGAADAGVLLARAEMAQGNFPEARAILERVCADSPQTLWPRVILSHALLQEGKDFVAAEKALRDILALDPNHAEARNNLAVLLSQKYRTAADEVFMGNVALAQLYDQACNTPSDINEHLPTLYALARECRHVTEMGTRTGVSTTALLYAQPEKLVCYDRVKYPQVERLRQLAGRTEFVFHQQDVLWAEIEETDLLFLDTQHDCGQLREELRLHAGKVRKYIVLHDTTTFGVEGETKGHRGLWPAVEEFLAVGRFRLKHRYQNNNGLTVLEALSQGGVASQPCV